MKPQTTFSTSNADRPSPRWFRKLKKASLVLTVAANAMIASWGLTDQLLVTRLQLWCTVGIVSILEALDIMLANGEEYAKRSHNKIEANEQS